ncbi:MAG: hypothetical protein ACYDCI_00050 [Candidatus Limnocylindrales bacterium]
MNLSSLLSTLIALQAGYAKYAPAIGLIATGVALITARNYGAGVQSVLQGIALVAAGTTAVSLHAAISRGQSAAPAA